MGNSLVKEPQLSDRRAARKCGYCPAWLEKAGLEAEDLAVTKEGKILQNCELCRKLKATTPSKLQKMRPEVAVARKAEADLLRASIESARNSKLGKQASPPAAKQAFNEAEANGKAAKSKRPVPAAQRKGKDGWSGRIPKQECEKFLLETHGSKCWGCGMIWDDGKRLVVGHIYPLVPDRDKAPNLHAGNDELYNLSMLSGPSTGTGRNCNLMQGNYRTMDGGVVDENLSLRDYNEQRGSLECDRTELVNLNIAHDLAVAEMIRYAEEEKTAQTEDAAFAKGRIAGFNDAAKLVVNDPRYSRG